MCICFKLQLTLSADDDTLYISAYYLPILEIRLGTVGKEKLPDRLAGAQSIISKMSVLPYAEYAGIS